MATSKQKIRSAFLNKVHFTAIELNDIGDTSESRKYISVLRAEGMPIGSYRKVKSSKRLTYYLEGQGLPDKKTT